MTLSRDYPIGFSPLCHQWDILHALKSGTDDTLWLCGGLGSGKSHVLVYAVFFAGMLWAPGVPMLLIEPDYQTFGDVFMQLWRQEIPGEGVLWEHTQTKYGPKLIMYPGGGVVTELSVRSAMNAQTVVRIDGPSYGLAFMDEPARMQMGHVAFEKIFGRTRLSTPIGNKLLIVGSPRGFNWVADAFGCTEDHPPHGWTHGYSPRPGYFIRACRTRDNREHQSAGYEDRQIRVYGERQARTELNASLVSAEGMIFPEWSKSLHVIPDALMDQLWNQRVVRRMGGCDWGFTEPAAVEVVGRTGDDELYCADEWYFAEKQVQEQGVAMDAFRSQYYVREWWGDKSDPGKIALLRKGYVEDGKRLSFPIKESDEHWQAGIDYLRHRMVVRREVPHPHLGDEFGCPRFLVAERCKELIREIPAYRQLEPKPGKGPAEGAMGDDHAIDAVRYAAWCSQKAGRVRTYGEPAVAS